MSRSRILFVNDHSFNHSGTPRYLVDTVRHLDPARFDVLVACPTSGPLTGELEALRVPLVITPMTSLTRETVLAFSLEVARHMRLLRERDIDLVHFNSFGWRDSLVVAAWLLGLPVLLHAHNPLTDVVMHGNLNVRLADRLLLNANATALPYTDTPSIARRFVTVYNGVDIRAFTGARSLRRELGLPARAPVVGTIGQICPRKGIQHFLRMIPPVLERVPDAWFMVVGRDAVGHEGYSETMKAEARRLNVADRVVFTGHRDDIPNVVRTLDLFVLASLEEPFGRVILEAMAGSRPVVVTDVGGVREICSRDEVGVLVPPDDPAALADAVVPLLQDPARRRRMARLGREHVSRRFSVEQVTRELEAVYEEALEARRFRRSARALRLASS